MKHIRVNTGYILLLILLLAGCGTTPAYNYYVLTARESAAPTGQTPSLGVGPIGIPEYLNRNALVYQRAGNQLQIAEYERWAEPLEEGVGRVLGLNLAALLNTQNVHSFPWHPERVPDYAVSVTVLALDANARRAVLEAEWLLYRPATAETVSRRISRLAYSSPDGDLAPEELPAAYSELIYQLSEEIARAITEPTGAEAGVPGGPAPAAESTAAESTAAESTAAESTAAESTAAESTAAESTAAESTAA